MNKRKLGLDRAEIKINDGMRNRFLAPLLSPQPSTASFVITTIIAPPAIPVGDDEDDDGDDNDR